MFYGDSYYYTEPGYLQTREVKIVDLTSSNPTFNKTAYYNPNDGSGIL